MSKTVTNTTQVTLPTELADRLAREGKAMGLSLPAFVAFLDHCRANRLDPKAQDAARFMFGTQADSLRKLAQ
ncbi:MAG: hypothetical protein JNK58_07655 [Phycisphaerae bacterium]|nr:hypothetical protein [Phycisphaerae bacterium]